MRNEEVELGHNQIFIDEAIREFGFSREDLNGHTWVDGTAYATIEFIKNRPPSFDPLQALNIIKGKNCNEIERMQDEIDHYKAEYQKNCVNNSYVFSKLFDQSEPLKPRLQKDICNFAFRKGPGSFNR